MTDCKRRSDCRLCGSRDLTKVLTLTPTPPANAFVPAAERKKKQATFPLELFLCGGCAHVQMLDVVDPRILFEHYVYVSGTSPVFVDHFRRYAESILRDFKPKAGALVVDVGSNDGTLLRFFKDAGNTVLGIDPAKEIAAEATRSGIETLNAFFDETLAKKIRKERGAAAVVTANNVFAHTDEMKGFTAGVRALLAPDGVFVFEVSYLADVVEKTLFDTIYHEHVGYHTVKPLKAFFAANGMELIEAIKIEPHGGSLRGIAQLKGGPRKPGRSVAERIGEEEREGLDRPERYKRFEADINARKAELGRLLRELKGQGKHIAGFGAPAKATTLMYHFQLGPDFVDFIVDDSPLKQGLFSPGFHIPVLPSSAIYEKKPDDLLVLAWNFAQPIIAKHKAFRDAGGHFIVPLPKVEVV